MGLPETRRSLVRRLQAPGNHGKQPQSDAKQSACAGMDRTAEGDRNRGQGLDASLSLDRGGGLGANST